MVRIYELTGGRPVQTNYCLTTEYEVKGGFVPKMVWVFETDENLSSLRKFVKDYFETVLRTDLFVMEVPQDSLLFEEEAERIYGATDAVCALGAE